MKRVEFRSRPTSIVGERFWIYAAKSAENSSALRRRMAGALMMAEQGMSSAYSGDSSTLVLDRPMVRTHKLNSALKLFETGTQLPMGVIVGSAIIEHVDQREDGMWQWHLADVQRVKKMRKPTGHPQPVWFTPF